ncbi:MAG: hypothetical protein D6797_06095 [Bdellovibrio sp.]|nr:MAG: hypothetical protein D6797_06095 [Bdellovibrio sp.]
MSGHVMASGAVQKKKIPSPILGMLLFVFTEIMFFSGLISAYFVIRSRSNFWVPPEGVRLPVLSTAFNTFALFLSGVLLYYAYRLFDMKGKREKALFYMFISFLLGSFFVGFQGFEWVRLFAYGMTLKSNIFSSVFYLLIGSHAAHALSGALAILFVWKGFRRKYQKDVMIALMMFWFMVVGIWPVLYGLLYF